MTFLSGGSRYKSGKKVLAIRSALASRSVGPFSQMTCGIQSLSIQDSTVIVLGEPSPGSSMNSSGMFSLRVPRLNNRRFTVSG